MTPDAPCWKCNGLGWLVDAARDGYTLYKPCPVCGGHGHIKHL